MCLRKPNCIAWIDIPENEYQDQIIEAKFRLDSLGGYAAAGIVFRIMDEDSYYMALVSSKGYFRLDVVKNNSPQTLLAWTEISDFNGININMNIITYGTSLILIVNGKWLGEVNDNSIISGRLGFALASYEESKEWTAESRECVCKAMLDYISVDTQFSVIEDSYKKWTNDSNINAEYRLRLAETFAVMNDPIRAMDQINRAWKRRDEVIRSVSAATSEVRTKKELLLAARMSFRLGQFNEAEEFIDLILDQWPDSPEGKLAYSEKLMIMNELNRFTELKKFAVKYSLKIEKDINYYTVIGRCYWNLKKYKESAEAWDKAVEIDSENGVYLIHAANAHEFANFRKKALRRFINAGKIFLNQDNNAGLVALMPKLSTLGRNNWEARAIIGKWAFSTEDYDKSAEEFSAANELRCALKPRPKADPALFYLWGLVYFIKGKNKAAIRLLEKAVKLAPDYELFSTKLEEIKSAYGEIPAENIE